jgi:hypothetical protein
MRLFSLLFVIILLTGISATAQESPKPKVYRPDIPGNFLIDFGVNGTMLSPENFTIGWFGSRSINLYYYYPIRLGKSKFSFNPGIGLGLERFKFKTAYYVADTLRDGAFEMVANFRPDSAVYKGLKKSFLGMQYVDIPLEFKFSANPEDEARTFWIAVGGRIGFLYNPYTKIKGQDDGERYTYKFKFNHGLNSLRYGPSVRVGIGNFNLFGFYNVNPLFAKDKGPDNTSMTTFTMGISIIGL